MRMNFKCECGNTTLEEVVTDVVNITEVMGFDGDDETTLEYGEQTSDGGEVERYQCASCGFTPMTPDNTPVNCPEKLYDWLVQNGMIDEPNRS